MPEDQERRPIGLTRDVIERICGKRPVGWYTCKVSQNTRRLLRDGTRALSRRGTRARHSVDLLGTPSFGLVENPKTPK